MAVRMGKVTCNITALSVAYQIKGMQSETGHVSCTQIGRLFDLPVSGLSE